MKTRLLLAFSAIVIVSAFMFDPVAQSPDYHEFADTRTLFGTPNFWNVLSNLPFLLVGAAGLWHLRTRERDGIVANLYPAYIIFFIGILLTAIGSSWYHLAPDSHTLVWDRFPMTIAFMTLFAIVIGEHVCDKSARLLLVPLLFIGAASVYYWQYTEAGGNGDLRPYALVQFLPMILIPIILLTYKSRYFATHVYWGMILLYAMSKLFEFFDYNVYEAGNILSGHSVKHLVAACVPALFLYDINTRRRCKTRPTG